MGLIPILLDKLVAGPFCDGKMVHQRGEVWATGVIGGLSSVAIEVHSQKRQRSAFQLRSIIFRRPVEQETGPGQAQFSDVTAVAITGLINGGGLVG